MTAAEAIAQLNSVDPGAEVQVEVKPAPQPVTAPEPAPTGFEIVWNEGEELKYGVVTLVKTNVKKDGSVFVRRMGLTADQVVYVLQGFSAKLREAQEATEAAQKPARKSRAKKAA